MLPGHGERGYWLYGIPGQSQASSRALRFTSGRETSRGATGTAQDPVRLLPFGQSLGQALRSA